jgi:ankyrin repeat protein
LVGTFCKTIPILIKKKEALHQICKQINKIPINIFQYLIETLGYDVNVQNNVKDTPLHCALGYSNPTGTGVGANVLMYLLSRENVDVNTKNNGGHNLLHTACKHINKLPHEIFKLLIETLGCDVNVQNNAKNTPIYCALYSFDPHHGGDITVLNYLLNQMGVDANIKGRFGYTLLHYACRKINNLPLEIFKLLIETKGSDVNAQDNDKNTPIHCALGQFNPRNGGDINVLAYLINQKTVNINTKYKRDHTLLHTTCIVNLSNTWYSAKLNEEYDTHLCQIAEMIVEKCIGQVLNDTTF